ncbi:D-alanyl-D-alanine carboxypeptidase family protein [Rhizobium sp. SSA_523]|uniref:D-alanyl-D-alanine carboxypeptidase family protein n=1 Tax=Rhizobium sp. SSA_523 TaxID=2952477 RepID=UPI00209142C7|nr:D-alanyl-D-alanine carboxypeptidase family protein [Rhizobium sp. SSA_523]MCO5733817.1 D-alanyl-D-alanine carboxypeptidase [Rhizobium sp. SSA_523]WKC24909.1 D-alanyl-D-alanine carboxypeptidase family protein [Rhizobium sp. SSA_523]
MRLRYPTICKSLPLLFALALTPAAASFAADARLADLKAKQIYLVENKTGTVLLAENENQAFPPASLAKLMTMDLVFEALRQGEVTPATVFKVSENAWRTGGAPSGTTTMFAALKSDIPLEDLIKGVVIQNANDACIVIAEGMALTEEQFARRMTARARDLGMMRSTFGNSTGLPDALSVTTAHDMVRLAQHIHSQYPDLYRLYAQPDFTWNKIFQRNKNPLLQLGIGIDGLGAGFAEGHGFAAVASVERDGTRLFLAMGGLASDKERQEEARRVLEWALTSFETRQIFEAGEQVGEAAVYGGASSHVTLVAAEAVDAYVPTRNAERLSGRIVYEWPLRAPVRQGQSVGVLKIFEGDRQIKEVPLQAAGDVAEGTLLSKATDALLELMFFWI